MDVKLRALELGLVLVLGCNVVCLYGLVRVLWADWIRRNVMPAPPEDDYGESLRRAIAARGSNAPKV